MAISNISFAETNSFPKMILDYISGNSALKEFYPYELSKEVIPQIIKAKQEENINRTVLVQTIQEQYSNIKTDNLVKANINALADKNTFCITTAHQLNIFGGPLYYIYKIACAINTCNYLKLQFPEYNFVPVYWMGSEDHDFEEINHIHLFGKTITWNDKQGGATGNYTTSSILPLIAEIRSMLGDLPYADELISIFEKAYAHDNLTEAARYLVNALFGKYGLVIVDGNCRSFKREYAVVMEDELLHQTSCRLVNGQLEKLASKGYKSQAFPREINLFYLENNSRERIVFENSKFKIQNSKLEFSMDELLAELKSAPEKFSPNVILRPLFQQKILPSLAYIGGGGELSYWMQLKPVFENYHVNFPQLIIRNSVLYISKNQQAKIEKLGNTVSDLFKDIDTLKKEFVLGTEKDEIDFSAEKNIIEKQFDQIKEKAKNIDASLVNTAGAEHQKAIQSIESIEKRLLRSLKQKNKAELNQLEKLKQQLFPENILQERYDNFSSYYATHGPSFIDMLVQELNPYQKEFLIIEE